MHNKLKYISDFFCQSRVFPHSNLAAKTLLSIEENSVLYCIQYTATVHCTGSGLTNKRLYNSTCTLQNFIFFFIFSILFFFLPLKVISSSFIKLHDFLSNRYIQGYPQIMRLQRRLYKIYTVCFLTFMIPCNCKLLYQYSKSL